MSSSRYPDGFRIVQAQNCHRINVNPADNILPPGSPCKGNFSGLWWTHGAAALKQDNAGGCSDTRIFFFIAVVVLDDEFSIGFRVRCHPHMHVMILIVDDALHDENIHAC